MRKSGLADSPFFSPPEKTERGVYPPSSEKSATKKKKTRAGKKLSGKKKTTKPPGNRDTTTPRDHGTTVSRYHATTVEEVRKAVKEIGKEAATHRFTVDEKKTIANILFAYKNSGTRTSENEITRIAVNFIINDYETNGENSILDRVLKALNE